MKLDQQISIAKRILVHLDAGAAESASEHEHITASRYLDESLWNEEIETLYEKLR